MPTFRKLVCQRTHMLVRANYTRCMTLSIGDLASRSGEPVKTVRFWSDHGLLPHERLENGYRNYPSEALGRVAFIRSAQALGFTLEEIKAILAIREDGRKPCREVRDNLTAHLAVVRVRLEVLRGLEADLASRLAWAEANPDPDCDEAVGCAYLAPAALG